MSYFHRQTTQPKFITDTVPVQLCPSAVVHGAAPGLGVAVAAAPLSAAAASAVCSATVVTAAARAGCLPSPLSGVKSCPLLQHLGPALLGRYRRLLGQCFPGILVVDEVTDYPVTTNMELIASYFC